MLRHTCGGRRIPGTHFGTQVERGIPEDVPLVGIDDVLCKLHAETAQRTELLVADPPQPLGDLEFNFRIGYEDRPGFVSISNRQLRNGWRPVDDAEPKAEPLVFGAWPLDE